MMTDTPAGLPPGWPTDEHRSRVAARSHALRNRRLALRTTSAALVVAVLGGAFALLRARDDSGAVKVGTAPTTTSTAAVRSAPEPKGWRIVDYGDARLAMPPDWTVFEPPGPLAHCAGRVTPKGPVILPESICLSAIAPGPHPTRAALKINGIRLYLLERGRVSSRYVVSELGVTLDVQRGDAARPVLDTLTSSARRVVLAPGRAPTVPDTWRTVTYAGITLRVPPTMRVFQLDSHTILGACGTQMFSSAAVFLGDGSRGIPTCAPMVSRGLPTPTDGVWIEHTPRAGPPPLGPPSSQFVDVVDVPGLRLGVYDATSDGTLRIEPQGSDGGWKSIVHIGLGPDSTIARTILYSIRASDRPG